MKSEPACLGMLESTSIAKGIEAADAVLKAAGVFPVQIKTICPGKFVIAVNGDVAAVSAALEAGKAVLGRALVDCFVIPNVHPDVPAALCGGGIFPRDGALGVLETFSAASIITAADAAVKAASVTLLDVRLAMGLGGKGYALIGGDVGAVQAAVAAGAEQAAEAGLLVESLVVPQPLPELWSSLA